MVFYPESAVERAMKIQEVILRTLAKRLTWCQAAEIIGISDRQMRRWYQLYQEFGYDGLFDRRLGRPSRNAWPWRPSSGCRTHGELTIYPSAGRSLSRMAVVCGPPATFRGAQLFSSPCPPRPRRTHDLLNCFNVVANLRFPYGLSHTVYTDIQVPFEGAETRFTRTKEDPPSRCPLGFIVLQS